MPRLYSDPYGEFNVELNKPLKNNGVLAACAQNRGVANQKSDLYSIPRYPMGGPYGTLVGFMEKTSMHALPVRCEKPVSSIMETNPPRLSICLEPGRVDIDQLQCFIHGDTDIVSLREYRIVTRTKNHAQCKQKNDTAFSQLHRNTPD